MPYCSASLHLNNQGLITRSFFSFCVLNHTSVLKIKNLLLCIVDDIFKIKVVTSVQNDTDKIYIFNA